MNETILGIDARDDLVVAVMLDYRGRTPRIVETAQVLLGGEVSLAEGLAELMAALKRKPSSCHYGLPTATCSLRNVTLPFADQRQVEQTLPMELEDQLITKVDDQVVDHLVTEQGQESTTLIAAMVDKTTLGFHLGLLGHFRLDPDLVAPGPAPLFQQLAARSAEAEILVVDAGSQAITMALCHRGKLVMLRRLGSREVLARPAELLADEPAAHDQAGLKTALDGVVAAIQQSMEIFEAETGIQARPQGLALTGPLSLLPAFVEEMRTRIGLETELVDLRRLLGLQVDENNGSAYVPALHDRALALALLRDHRNPGFNFRKQEFARRHGFFASRIRVAATATAALLLVGAATGWLYADYRQLRAASQGLETQTLALFKETFPEVGRIVDPLQQMRAKVDELQAPDTGLAMIGQDKRVLGILADFSAHVPKELDLRVQRLAIDHESVQIKATTDTFQTVDRIKNQLAASSLFTEVAIVSATAEKEDNMIRFQMRLLLRGNG